MLAILDFSDFAIISGVGSFYTRSNARSRPHAPPITFNVHGRDGR
jgi:hypothetical protein